MYKTEHQKMLKEFFEGHPEKGHTALSILDYFQSKINKATIYRQLATLEQQNVIRKSFNVQKNCYEYQYAKECQSHFHLVCKKCQKTIHLNCRFSDAFTTHILQEHAFLIDLYESVIYGICKECER